MEQWGFYFDQSRCVGCKACMTSCKNWNELRRGDAKLNELVMDRYNKDNPKDAYQVSEGSYDKGANYINPATGENNYDLYRKFYMKEEWRRVENFDRGAFSLTRRQTPSTPPLTGGICPSPVTTATTRPV